MDRHAYSNGLTDANPLKKGAFAGTLLGIALVFDISTLHLLIALGTSIIVIIMGKVDFRVYLKLFMIPGSFLILSILTLLVSISTDQKNFLISGEIFGFYFGVVKTSLSLSWLIFTRCLATLSIAYFTALTIPVNQMVVIMKKLRLPSVLIELIVLMYRFINIFIKSFYESYNALILKNGFADLRKSRKSISLLAAMMFNKILGGYKDWRVVLETKNFNGDFHV
ncbi:CbiQ family ECF transporter T component [Alkalibacter mobilis]|uniref:CbiQ family ECF transporter T component n=1 Tax=Alkalibacter mobilis TaxID=2787712 RepID=UPI00189D9943|nr:CbiQ family ECF transporter T component [Alkalibacter mobilis]